jgi:hypothetical protein
MHGQVPWMTMGGRRRTREAGSVAIYSRPSISMKMANLSPDRAVSCRMPDRSPPRSNRAARLWFSAPLAAPILSLQRYPHPPRWDRFGGMRGHPIPNPNPHCVPSSQPNMSLPFFCWRIVDPLPPLARTGQQGNNNQMAAGGAFAQTPSGQLLNTHMNGVFK